MSVKHFVLFIVFIIPFCLFSQEGVIRGHVYDSNSSEPIIYGNVSIKNTTLGTTTDLDGFFLLSDIPAGDQILVVSYIGYESLELPVIVKDGNISYQKVMLAGSDVQLQTVDISGRREQARSEVQISQLQVTPKEIKALPSTGGDADIVQYLQVLPGVISTGDQGGQLFVRGGSPVQNKILLDGMTIYNPFHSVGFYSIFETEIIKNVEVLTGGFNAEYGGRISAIIDINTREGNPNKLSGQVTGSPFMVKGLIEGPIVKQKEGGSSTSFILTTKRSIIEQTSPSLYSYAAVNDSIGLPFFFNDIYGKLSFKTDNGSQFNLFGFNFQDRFDNPLVARIGWENAGGGINFNLLPKGSSLIINGLAGFSNYNTEIEEGDEQPRSSGIREYFVGLDFSLFTNTIEVKYGIELSALRTEFDFTNPFDQRLEIFQNTTEVGGFVKFRKSWDRLVIEPSVRVQYYASLTEFSLEPRIGVKFNMTDNIRLKGAAGMYSQSLISTSNERDVVNLFTGFLSGPDESFNDFDGERVSSRLQKAAHAVAGIEVDLFKGLQVNVEGYIKDFNQLVIVNRNKIRRSDSNYATETGLAKGIDFSFKYDSRNWYIWSTYSLGFVDRFDGDQEFRTIFDRRHNVNFLASYTFGDNKDWQVSARWNFGSGFPFTKTQAFYNQLSFLDGVSTEYETENPSNVGIIFSETRNGGELPFYHRLDLSAQKVIHFSKHINLEIVASVSNVYDRENIFFFDRVRFERVNQLPILPSVGIKFNF